MLFNFKYIFCVFYFSARAALINSIELILLILAPYQIQQRERGTGVPFEEGTIKSSKKNTLNFMNDIKRNLKKNLIKDKEKSIFSSAQWPAIICWKNF